VTSKTEKSTGSTRADQKKKTRRAIIDAVLRLSAAQGFSSVSLREVAREAGISPNAFYSHFHDLEELRLSIIDEGGVTLRRVMREVRRHQGDPRSIVRIAVETFLDYLQSNGDLFRLMISTRSGGSLEARRAVYKEINRFFEDLTEDIELASQATGRKLSQIPQVAHAVTTIVFNGAMALLDLPDTDPKKLAEELVQEIRLVTLGAEALASGWRPERNRPQQKTEGTL